jgi:hypothetical protein
MKRIIRLTETDLTNIVKRIIKEQDEVKLKKSLTPDEKKSYDELKIMVMDLTPEEIRDLKKQALLKIQSRKKRN